MKRAGWNATRRNRNIGTSQQGHGNNNILDIPQPADTVKDFNERFESAEVSMFTLHRREIPVIVEQLKHEYFYPCTPADVLRILQYLPESDLEGFGVVIFRQPKQKEVILSSVWGRLLYSFAFKDDYYPALILEAMSPITTYRYPKVVGKK